MCNIVVSIHFKYILAGRQDLILTSVAHLRKRLPRKVPDVRKNKFKFTRFRGSSADAHPCDCETATTTMVLFFAKFGNCLVLFMQ